MKTLYLFLLLAFFSFLLKAQNISVSEKGAINYGKGVESKISYNKEINTNTLNYKLEPVSEGSFKLIFINQPKGSVNIKIYDIIGNLVLTDENKYSINSEIEYNFNEMNNRIYVVKVEVGSEKLTKKVNL